MLGSERRCGNKYEDGSLESRLFTRIGLRVMLNATSARKTARASATGTKRRDMMDDDETGHPNCDGMEME